MTIKAKIKKLMILFNLLFKDVDRKPLLRIFFELVHLTLIHKQIPYFYFSRHLHKKYRENIGDFLPNSLFLSLSKRFNNQDDKYVMENKLFFNFYYKQFKINLPEMLMYNHGNLFVAGERSFSIRHSGEFKDLIIDMLNNQHIKSVFIKKTSGSFGGRNIFKVSLDRIKNDPNLLEDVYQTIHKSSYIFQNEILQHPGLNTLNASSVNTARLDTFIDKQGNIEVMSGFIRMSLDHKFVDNVSSGGCCVNLDINTGKLGKYAYTSFSNSGGNIFQEHPVSKVVFENYEIPRFSEAKDLVIKAAGCMPGLRLIGWDVAFSVSGPVLIEGNVRYDISGNDLNYGGYRSNPVFRKVLNEINYL